MSTTTMTKKPTHSNQQFVGKKIGANFIATLGKERYSRKVTMEEGELLFKKMTAYNKKPTDTMKNQIIKLLTPAAVKAKKEKEAVAAKAKGIKHQIKKEAKKSKSNKVNKDNTQLIAQLESAIVSNDTTVDELQAILDKYKKKEEAAPKAEVTSAPRIGEAYRNY